MYSGRKITDILSSSYTDAPGSRDIEEGLQKIKAGVERLRVDQKYIINAYTLQGLLNATHPRTCWDLDCQDMYKRVDTVPTVWHVPIRSLNTVIMEDLLPYKLHGFYTYFLPVHTLRREFPAIPVSRSALDTDYVMITVPGMVNL